jgi:SAM-dependent methyltransferase
MQSVESTPPDRGAVPTIRWLEGGRPCEARWRAPDGASSAARGVVVDAKMSADEAYGLACQGTALLWRGDFHEARRLLSALGNRADRPRRRGRLRASADDPQARARVFHLHRQARSQRARTLNALLIPLGDDDTIPLPRAPDARPAIAAAYGPPTSASLTSLRALLGVIGAHEWRTKGIELPEAGGRIHPHYGVFAPIRREYVDLVATTPLPPAARGAGVAFDVGTGTGVLAAVLARRGVGRVIATDLDSRALECARENARQLGLADRIDVVEADLFPPGRAALVVCNPPWIPARPSSPMEGGIYDPESRMLRGFLSGLRDHLEHGGEGWLILSDLAEHLGLRTRAQLLAEFAAAGLRVADRHDVRPRHPRAADATDPLHFARAAEVTSLWRLVSL